MTYNGAGLPISVIDNLGRSINITYNATGRVSSITDPAGGLITYSYDTQNNLVSVTYPDGRSKTYHYNEPELTSGANLPHALTGITDENGDRYATYQYSADGKAITTSHANGANLHTLSYGTNSTTVTDPLGTVHTHNLTTILGVTKSTGQSQPGGAGCGPVSSATTYDAQGNVASRVDFNGNKTCYAYDMTRNLETARVEGLVSGTACSSTLAAYTPSPNTAQRKILTEWHPTFRLPVKITEAGREITSVYDDRGNITSYNIKDTILNQTRTWTTTYLYHPSVPGVLSQKIEDGPRTEVADLTTTDYYLPDENCVGGHYGCRGQARQITNALGHVTQITHYTAHGQPEEIVDPNGLVTTLAYDARGRLVSRTVGTRVTAYTYDAAGNLVGLTLPDGSQYAYTYDTAHRLVGIQDAQGNRIAYTLDGLGNITAEAVFDAQGNPARQLTRQYDALGRLWKEIRRVNGQDAITAYGHDAQGNPTARVDPLGHAGTRAYDALNRLAQTQDALGGVTLTAHDALDQTTAITDPKGLATVYETDAFSQVRKETSPDRGVTTYTYDAAGNLKTKTDARGVVTTYTYDAINRLTQQYWNPDIYANYQYDTGANGIGRLARMDSLRIATTWSYDAHGAVTGKQQTLKKQGGSPGSVTQSLLSAYDAGGRLTQMTYPSGKVVAFAYSQGKVSQITVNGQVLMSGLQYQPFGGPHAWTWGNGTAYARSFDANGWPIAYPLGSLSRSLAYDAAGRITGYGHAGQPNYNQAFAYDALDRLSGATAYQGSQAWQYDANGNRTQAGAGANTYAYAYTPNTNRLQSVAGPLARSYAYDAAGNVTGDGVHGFLIDMTGRLRDAWGAWGSASYKVDGLGQRIQKTVYTRPQPYVETYTYTFYAYDDAGHLIGEYDANGQALQETVWLGDAPVAVLKAGVLYYVHADHLDAPRVITDTQNRVVWRWDNADPFGVGPPNENPSELGTFTYHLRFPGQFFDQETGLHYNYFRDSYDPRGGRYLQADPIGVAGGINLYQYAKSNPLSFTDPDGRNPIAIGAGIVVVGGVVIAATNPGGKIVYPPGYGPTETLDPLKDTHAEVQQPSWPAPKNPLDCEARYSEDKERCRSSCGDGSVGAQALCLAKAWLKYRACRRISNPAGSNWTDWGGGQP